MIDSLSISGSILTAVRKAIAAEAVYQRATNCGRKFGVTGEVGEILVCHALGLKLVKHPRSEGFDALDAEGSRVQIKTRRGEKDELPRDTGRISKFSAHEYDYALLAILTKDYKLHSVWRADYSALKPIIAKHKRSNPTIYQFKRAGKQVLP